ncbi:MAG: hypothetical protein ACR2QC_09590 [Gammaproteobacteria bacterium]
MTERKNAEGKIAEAIRARPLPGFVDGEWVNIQFGTGNPKRRIGVARRLAKQYAHWTGDEEGMEFYEKMARDLAIPGFLGEVFDALSGGDGKKPKTPFHFMFGRVVSKAKQSSGKKFGLNDPDVYKDVLRAALREKRLEDARDFAFFAAIWLGVPGEIAEIIKGSPADKHLGGFLRDFAEKNAKKNAALQIDALAKIRDEWRKLSRECVDALQAGADGDPDAGAAKKAGEFAEQLEKIADKYSRMRDELARKEIDGELRGMLDKISPFADKPAVAPLREYLARLADGGPDAPDFSAAVGELKNKVDEIVELLNRRKVLLSEMRKRTEAEDMSAVEIGEKIKEADGEINAAVSQLLPETGGQKQNETRESEASAPPPKARIAAAKVTPQSVRQTRPAIDAASESVRRPETRPEPPQKKPSAAAVAEANGAGDPGEYARRINVLVMKLILLDEFDAAYHIAKCGEAEAPGKITFPPAALHILAFPEQSGGRNGYGELEDLPAGGGDETGKIAVFAAALFPAVFYLSSGARTLYRARGPLSDCGGDFGLDKVRARVESFDTWPVAPSDFKEPSAADARDIVADRRRELSEWHDVNKAKTLRFAPATHAWEKWLKAGGVLGGIIRPLVEGAADLRAAEDFLRRYDGDDAAAREIGKISGKKIEGGAKKQLRDLFREGVSLVRKTADAMCDDGKPSQKTGALHEKCRAFRQSLEHLRRAAASERGDDSVRAARRCLRRALGFFEAEAVELILSGKGGGRAPGLAKITGARHDCAGYPFKYSRAIVGLAEDALRNGWFEESVAAACRRQIGADAMLSAEMLSAHAGAHDKRELETLIRRTTGRLQEELKERIDGIERKLNSVQMPQGGKEDLREKLMRVEPERMPCHSSRDSEIIVDFPQARAIVETVASDVDRVGDEKTRELRERLRASGNDAGVSGGQKDLAREMLDKGNHIFAEYLMDSKDPDILKKVQFSAPHIRLFFEGGYIDGASSVAEENFVSADGDVAMGAETRKRRRALVAKWRAMFSGDGVRRENAVKQWLDELNFGVQRAAANGAGRLVSVDVKARTLSSSPVADFGARANGRYVVILAAADATIAEMHESADGAPGDGARLVFYDGVLQEKDRVQFRARNEDVSSRKKAFFDRASLFYLCGLPEQADVRRVFFDLSLPFAGVNPFVALRGDVPEEMFYGRRREMGDVIGESSCLVYGGRMLGKTALLHHVRKREHRPENRCYAIVLDLKEGENAARLLTDLSGVWDIIWNKICEAAPGAKSGRRGADKKLEDWLSGDGRRLLVMLDEADDFLEKDIAAGSPNLTRFKNLMDRHGGNFKAVFAGLHNVKRSTRRANAAIARFGRPVCVGPFEGGEQADAVRLISEPFAAAGFVFEDDMLPLEVANRANFYPSLIQYFCHHWLKDLRSISGGVRMITAAHVKRAFVKKDLSRHLAEVFDGTLNLDRRYALIAYGIARKMREEREEFRVAYGLSAEQIRRECQEWKEEAVKNLTPDEFQCLLEEMADLGVLRSTGLAGDVKWLLRSDLVLLLIGDKKEVEEKLLGLLDEDFTTSLHSAELYRRPSPEGGYSPLTLRQESVLTDDMDGRKRWRCRAVLGGRAAGMDSAAAALRGVAAREKWSFDVHHGENGIGGMRRALSGFTKKIRGEGGERGILAVADAPWSREWLDAVMDDSASSKYKTLVVFLGDGGCVRHLRDNVPRMFLGPVGDAFLGAEMRDRFNKNQIAEIEKISGNFVLPVNALPAGGGGADEELREWAADVAVRGRAPEFWGLPALWGRNFYELMNLVADDGGAFGEEDLSYGLGEAGGGDFADWTASEIISLLHNLSLSLPLARGWQLIAPLHNAVKAV